MTKRTGWTTLIFGVAISISSVASACGTYEVRPGDTLTRIARVELGTEQRATDLYRLNISAIGTNPNLIAAGTVLQLPCGDGVLSSGWSPLLTPERAQAVLDQRRAQVLDLRGSDKLSDGVLRRTISIPFQDWRGPKENPGAPPALPVLERMIGLSGLRLDRPIVIVAASGAPMQAGRAAYVYWMLKSVGATQLAILEGGMAAWRKEDRPVVSSVRRPRPYFARLSFDTTWWADTDEVQAIASGKLSGTLLDARPERVYRRPVTEGQQSVPSTLPGAQNSPAPGLLSAMRQENDPVLGIYGVLEQLKAAPALWEAETVVSFCDTGELGALNWFFASEVAGIQNVKLYPDSTFGWKDAGLPLAAPAPPPAD